MKRFLALAITILTVAVAMPAYARPDTAPTLPEQAGIYDVPGHKDMKLRVFVYKAKPGPSTPALACGLSDPASSTVVSGAGWHLPSSWTYVVNTSSAPATIGASNMSTITANAFATWHAQVPSVAISLGGTTSVNRAIHDGQNIITWGRTSGSALAVSYIWYQNGVASEVDTIFNNKFKWYWAGGGTQCAYSGVYDAQDILTHELGHTFGLDDVYTADYTDATMYGYGSTGEVKKNTLSSGDISGVQSLY